MIVDEIKNVEFSVLRAHHGCKFRQNQPADRLQCFLSLQHATEFCQVGLKPILLGVFVRGVFEVADHFIDGVFQHRHFPLCLHRDGPRQVTLRDGGGHFGNGAYLRGQVLGELIDVFREALPRARGTRHLGLAAELSFHANFARHARYLFGKDGERVDHTVDGIGQRGDFSLCFHCQLLFQVTVGHRRHDFCNSTYLAGQVAGHEVHAVGQIFPGAGYPLHLRLTSKAPLGSNLTCHPRNFGRK